MKNNFASLLLLILIFIPGVSSGDTSAEHPSDTARDLQAVEQFFALNDEQLDQLIAALSRIRAMSTEERERLAAEIVRFRSLPEERRRQMRDNWKVTGKGLGRPENPDQWREMMSNLQPEERQRIQQTLQSLTPADRAEFRRKQLLEWQKRSANE